MIILIMLKRTTIKPIPIQTKNQLTIKKIIQRIINNNQKEAISQKEKSQRMLKNHQKERNDSDKCYYKLFMLIKPCFNTLFKNVDYESISRSLNNFNHFKFLFYFVFCFSNIFEVVGDNENHK